MKKNFAALDTSIIETLTERPLHRNEILTVTAIREEALRLNIRRAGVSPSESADVTVNERLQALRRDDRIIYDLATNRWEILQ